jgi:hypothetical protein
VWNPASLRRSPLTSRKALSHTERCLRPVRSFDLIVTALLDQTYQHADNVYRNWTRALAALVAVVLAVVGGHTLTPPSDTLQSVIVGLLATPLAPIAKDLSTALATAVNTMLCGGTRTVPITSMC